MGLQEHSANGAAKPRFTACREVLQIHVVVRVEPMTSVATRRFQPFEILAGINVIVGELLSERDDHKLFAIEFFIRFTFRAAEVPTILVHFRQCLLDDFVLCQSKIPI